jgi:hypothetical protein
MGATADLADGYIIDGDVRTAVFRFVLSVFLLECH